MLIAREVSIACQVGVEVSTNKLLICNLDFFFFIFFCLSNFFPMISSVFVLGGYSCWWPQLLLWRHMGYVNWF